jgi:hypothetical protein
VGIFIPGLGCSAVGDDMHFEQYGRYLMNIYKYDQYHAICNSDMRNQVKNVAKRIFRIKPSLKNDFIQNVFAILRTYLKSGYRLVIIGHSYGGSVVSRIAEILLADSSISSAEKSRVDMATFGSIYIPKIQMPREIRIAHYMDIHDIALKTIPFSPPTRNPSDYFNGKMYFDTASRIVWLHRGIDGMWDTHNGAYETIERDIHKRRGVF